MKIKSSFLFIALLASATIFNGCAKDGATGPAGKDGNANVTSSNTVTLNNWSSDFDDGTDYTYSSTISWASITQAIKDKGIVMVYADDKAGSWVALPYTDAGTGYSSTLNFYVKVGSVKIEYTGYDSPSPGTSSLNGTIVRIVAIASSSREAHPNVDLKNYNEVKKVFNLKD